MWTRLLLATVLVAFAVATVAVGVTAEARIPPPAAEGEGDDSALPGLFAAADLAPPDLAPGDPAPASPEPASPGLARNAPAHPGADPTGAPPDGSPRDVEVADHLDAVDLDVAAAAWGPEERADAPPADAPPVGPPPDPDPPLVSAEGFHVAAGRETAPPLASSDARRVRYTVEVEPALGGDLLAVTAVVEEALHDARSWARRHRLERVSEPGQAQIRVLVATPSTVDRLCGQVGLRTNGRYSCWNGRFAALNGWRWEEGASDFDDLTTYRRYLVNHEVGHGLGYGHVGCPARGALAPLMMQQSISTGACTANPWPFPEVEPA